MNRLDSIPHFKYLLFLFQPVDASDEAFWSQFWSDTVSCIQDVFTLIPAAEIRALREESPSNLATLCYKAVEKLVQAAESGCRTAREQQTGNNLVEVQLRNIIIDQNRNFKQILKFMCFIKFYCKICYV